MGLFSLETKVIYYLQASNAARISILYRLLNLVSEQGSVGGVRLVLHPFEQRPQLLEVVLNGRARNDPLSTRVKLRGSLVSSRQVILDVMT